MGASAPRTLLDSPLKNPIPNHFAASFYWSKSEELPLASGRLGSSGGWPPTLGTHPASCSPLPGYRPQRGGPGRAGRVVRCGPRPPLSPTARSLPGGYISGGPGQGPAPAGVLGNRSRYTQPRSRHPLHPRSRAAAAATGREGAAPSAGLHLLLLPGKLFPVFLPPSLSSLRGTLASLNRL